MILIGPPSSDASPSAAGASADVLVDALIEEGVAPKTIARVVSRTTALSRNQVYAQVLSRRGSR